MAVYNIPGVKPLPGGRHGVLWHSPVRRPVERKGVSWPHVKWFEFGAFIHAYGDAWNSVSSYYITMNCTGHSINQNEGKKNNYFKVVQPVVFQLLYNFPFMYYKNCHYNNLLKRNKLVPPLNTRLCRLLLPTYRQELNIHGYNISTVTK